MDDAYFDFGLDLRLPDVSVRDDGRAALSAPGRIVAAPYFEQLSWSDAEPVRLSHLLTRPFPGHEWNHFALYALQRAPVEIMCGVAYAGLRLPQAAPARWRRADREAIEQSFQRLERLLRVYHSLFGPRETKRITQALREEVSSRSFIVCESEGPPPLTEPQAAGQVASDLDAAYLHACFAREAFHAYLDIRVHEAQGRNPDEFLLRPVSDTPLLRRLLDMSPKAAAKFLITWRRRSYRFPRFTKRFFHSVAKLPVRRAKFEAEPGEPLE